MSHWILIIFMQSSVLSRTPGAPAVTTAVFQSKDSCEAAAARFDTEVSKTTFGSGHAFCVEDK